MNDIWKILIHSLSIQDFKMAANITKNSTIQWLIYLKDSEKPIMLKQTGLMPRLRSRFRYSGRTQFQTRQIAAMENRDSPAFDRVMSKRGTFAGRTHNMRKRDEGTVLYYKTNRTEPQLGEIRKNEALV